MEIVPNQLYAVVTGDIIRSSQLQKKVHSRLNRVLKSNAKLLSDKFKGFIPYEMDFFRGDSWQVVILNPEMSLRIALLFRLLLHTGMSSVKVDTRMAIGVGNIDFVPENNVSSGIGEAFTISGRGLERMPRNQFTSFYINNDENEDIAICLQIITKLIDAIATKWTLKQAKAIQGALFGLSQDQISSTWDPPITQPTVANHLKRASWGAIENGLDYFERTLKEYQLNRYSRQRL